MGQLFRPAQLELISRGNFTRRSSDSDLCALSFKLAAFSLCFENTALERSRTRRATATRFFVPCDFGRAPFLSGLLDCIEQPFSRQFSILHLRARVLYGDADPTPSMTKRYGGCNLVYALAARTGRPRKNFLQVGFLN